jgi:hypothetical protein
MNKTTKGAVARPANPYDFNKCKCGNMNASLGTIRPVLLGFRLGKKSMVFLGVYGVFSYVGCSPGLSRIGWNHLLDLSMPLEHFEKQRARTRRRSSHGGIVEDLILSRQDREEILMEWGASFAEIIEAIRLNVKVKNQRRRTVNAIGTYDRIEEMMENTTRQIKKTLQLKKKGGSQGTTQSAPSATGTRRMRREYTYRGPVNVDSSSCSSQTSRDPHSMAPTSSSGANDYGSNVETPASSDCGSSSGDPSYRRPSVASEDFSLIDEEIVAVIQTNSDGGGMSSVAGEPLDLPISIPQRSPSVESALTDPKCFGMSLERQEDSESTTEDEPPDLNDNIAYITRDVENITITEDADDATMPSKYLQAFDEFLSATKDMDEYHPKMLHVNVTAKKELAEGSVSALTPVVYADPTTVVSPVVAMPSPRKPPVTHHEPSAEPAHMSIQYQHHREIYVSDMDICQPLSPISELTSYGYHSFTSFDLDQEDVSIPEEDGSFEFLVRDSSFWELRPGPQDSPILQRKPTSVVISEEATVVASSILQFMTAPVSRAPPHPAPLLPNNATEAPYQYITRAAPVSSHTPPPVPDIHSSALFPVVPPPAGVAPKPPQVVVVKGRDHLPMMPPPSHVMLNGDRPYTKSPPMVGDFDDFPQNNYALPHGYPSAFDEEVDPTSLYDVVNGQYQEPSFNKYPSWEQHGFRMEPPPNSSNLLHKMMM